MPISLEFTPPSKHVVQHWGTDRVKEVEKVQRLWVDGMDEMLGKETDQSFTKQRQPGGAPWPVNSESWRAYKASKGYSTLTNIYTGAMRASITTTKTGDSAAVSCPLDYAESAMKDRSFIPTENLVSSYARIMCERLLRRHMK